MTGLVATTPMDVVLDTQRVGDEKIDRVALAAAAGEISDAVAGKLLLPLGLRLLRRPLVP
ncbi:MAG: hypothetical protein IH849_14690 [Acidobacteria bacterium]|nr:hypothetical protein [Acidobacteriota bacterium]